MKAAKATLHKKCLHTRPGQPTETHRISNDTAFDFRRLIVELTSWLNLRFRKDRKGLGKIEWIREEKGQSETSPLAKRYGRNMTHLHGWMTEPREENHAAYFRRIPAYMQHWCKLFKSTHQSKDPDQENASSQVTATTTSPYNNRHSCWRYRSEKETDRL